SNRLDAELLLGEVLGKSKTELILLSKNELTDEQNQNFLSLVERRKAGEPVAYILGRRDFYKSTFFVGPGVLIPRPETEHIVEDVVEYASTHEVKRILDLGVGTGCIGLSCLLELPEAMLVGIEKSEEALEFAEKNADALDLSNRVEWLEGDVEEYAEDINPEPFDVIVANPPYIGRGDTVMPAVVKYEPHQALFSKNDGYYHLQSWAKVAIPRLRPGGLLVFEIGAGQGPQILNFFEKTQAFEELRIKKDLAGLDRRLWGIRKPQA
ncbi:MAG: peptide chain release factor N(5)-glutamine methyltransferase, partial [Bdellovibrionales bacterium]|nr:peptide chain release factor N(5)-glutamine methyltransferase [Bdellovibrionales bacterium]